MMKNSISFEMKTLLTLPVIFLHCFCAFSEEPKTRHQFPGTCISIETRVFLKPSPLGFLVSQLPNENFQIAGMQINMGGKMSFEDLNSMRSPQVLAQKQKELIQSAIISIGEIKSYKIEVLDKQYSPIIQKAIWLVFPLQNDGFGMVIFSAVPDEFEQRRALIDDLIKTIRLEYKIAESPLPFDLELPKYFERINVVGSQMGYNFSRKRMDGEKDGQSGFFVTCPFPKQQALVEYGGTSEHFVKVADFQTARYTSIQLKQRLKIQGKEQEVYVSELSAMRVADKQSVILFNGYIFGEQSVYLTQGEQGTDLDFSVFKDICASIKIKQ